MNMRHSHPHIAGSFLALAILACNMGATPPAAESDTTPPTESAAPDLNTTIELTSYTIP